MVYCTLLPRPCCHTVRRALSKRVRVVKISSFQLFPTNVIPFHGPSQRICLTLSLPCIICTRPLPCLGSCLRPTRRTLRTSHRREPWTTISAPSLATLLRLPFSRRPQLSAYITLIPPKFPTFQLRLRTTRPFLAPSSVFLPPLLPVRTGRSEP
jgi:hypothetical protein